LVQHFDEKMYSLKIGQLVVVGVDAGAKEQASVTTVDNLGRASELDKIGLVFLISWCNEAVDLRTVRSCDMKAERHIAVSCCIPRLSS